MRPSAFNRSWSLCWKHDGQALSFGAPGPAFFMGPRVPSRMNVKFHVTLEPQPEGGFAATCVELPGAISEGDTEPEALDNITDAIRMVLAHRQAKALESARGPQTLLRTVDVDAEAPT